MTTQRLTDAALRRALAELAEGPDAGPLVADVMVAVEARPQASRLGWPVMVDRRWLLVGLAALLLVGAVVAVGMRLQEQPVLGVRAPFLFVLERWNGLVDPGSIVELTAIDPSSGASVPISGAPRNASHFRWTPDGTRVAFLTGVAEISDRGLGGPRPQLVTAGLSVANADWSVPYVVNLAQPIEDYDFGDLGDGLAWAPTGDRFAVGWSNGNCIGDPDACVVDGNIDLFSPTGSPLATIAVPAGFAPRAIWSHDGSRLGWYQFECRDNNCSTTSFRWRRWDGIGGVSGFEMPGIGGVTWPPDERLVAYTADASGVKSVFSIGVDGAARRDVPGWGLAGPSAIVALSPGGTALASLNADTGALRVDDLRTGRAVNASIPVNLNLIGWSPDGQWLVLWASQEDNLNVRVFSVVGSDGTGFREIGQGDNFAWAPASVISGK